MCQENMKDQKKAVRYYKWVAEYDNGKIVQQGEVGFKKVLEKDKEGKVRQFALLANNPLLHKNVLINLNKDKRLIYFERTVGSLSGEFDPFLVYLVGYQMTVGGKNIKVINYIYPNGHIETTDEEPELLNDFIEAIKKGK